MRTALLVLPFILAGCGAYHNPTDLAKIKALQSDLDSANNRMTIAETMLRDERLSNSAAIATATERTAEATERQAWAAERQSTDAEVRTQMISPNSN